jgi:hypothetical protein
MKNKKEISKCDECNGKIIKDEIRGEYYCEKCGLVRDPAHAMGRGINGLIDYMFHNRLNDYVDSVRLVFKNEGLAKARLMVSKL